MTGTRPRSVTVIGGLFIAFGAIGLVYHATELDAGNGFQYDELLVLFVRLLAIVSGFYVLRGANWARWLTIAWMAYHVALSTFHSVGDTILHAVLLAVIGYVLLRPEASAYFRRPKRQGERPVA
jgi:hypothetical protein